MNRRFFAVTIYPGSAIVDLGAASKGFDLWAPFQQIMAVSKPVEFVLRSGSQRADCLYGGSPTVMLASDALREQLVGCSGLKFFPVLLSGKSGIVEKFRVGLNVIGRCGRLNLAAHPTTNDVRMGPRLSVASGIRVDEQKWDGSDVFCFEDLGKMLVTERVADRLNAANLVGVAVGDVTALPVFRLPGDV